MKLFDSSKIRLVLLGFIAAAIFALPLVASSQTGDWIVYNTSNSDLPQNLITALTCDDWGNVWIGTGDPFGRGQGVAKFDGNIWTVYNTFNSDLPYNAVFSLTPDNQGGVWIGTAGGLTSVGRGLAHFDGQSWIVYDTSNSGLPHNNVMALTLDAQGNLWIGTDSGLAQFDGVNWNVYSTLNSGLPHNSVYAIAIDDQANKWIGTYGGGLAMFDGTAWEIFNRSNSGLPHNNVYSIAIDHQQTKWIGTAVHISGTVSGGLAKFDNEDWRVYNKANSGLPHDDVYTVAIDVDGSVWTGTGEHIPASVGGLARFDGVNWTVYNKQNSEIPYNLVYTIAIDTRGNKWIGSINFDEPGGLVVCRVGAQPTFDFNGDGIVDAADMCMMIDYWGTDEPLYDIAPPLFGDGIVDVQDLILLAEHLFEGAGLVACWALDESEGDIAYDSAGDIDAAVHDGQWADGKVGGALQFNGFETYMDCGDSQRLGTRKMTLAMWLEPQHMGGMRYILSRAKEGSDIIDYALMRHLDGQVEFAVGQGDSDSVSVLSNATTPLNEWTHVAVCLNGSEVTIYINGRPDVSANYAERVSRDEGYRLMISSLGGDTRFYHGKIDEVRVYNVALTTRQIEGMAQ